MSSLPDSVSQFLSGSRYAVAGVSRTPNQPANAIYRRLVDSGFEVFPINPNASEVEGARCFGSIAEIPTDLDGVVIATPPTVSAAVVRDCAEKGVRRVWFHRSFGEGSVSAEAIKECERLGIDCIPGGCPMMFCEPVDFGHKCMRWWLQRKGRVPM